MVLYQKENSAVIFGNLWLKVPGSVCELNHNAFSCIQFVFLGVLLGAKYL